MRHGQCAACRIETITAANRGEVLRLYRKRLRYAMTGASLHGIDRQLQRVLQRIWAEILAVTNNESLTQRHFDALMASIEAEGHPVLTALLN